MIQAVTFDFWDTLVIDDSDEPARAARGLPTKVETRRQLFVEEVLRHQPGVSPGRAAQALQQALTAFGTARPRSRSGCARPSRCWASAPPPALTPWWPPGKTWRS